MKCSVCRIKCIIDYFILLERKYYVHDSVLLDATKLAHLESYIVLSVYLCSGLKKGTNIHDGVYIGEKQMPVRFVDPGFDNRDYIVLLHSILECFRQTQSEILSSVLTPNKDIPFKQLTYLIHL